MQVIDLYENFAAYFFINPSKPRSGAAWRCLYKRFPTKLSTENVSQAAVSKRAGAGRRARGGLRKLRHNPPLLSSCAE
jgi:hypothetical protein